MNIKRAPHQHHPEIRMRAQPADMHRDCQLITHTLEKVVHRTDWNEDGSDVIHAHKRDLEKVLRTTVYCIDHQVELLLKEGQLEWM